MDDDDSATSCSDIAAFANQIQQTCKSGDPVRAGGMYTVSASKRVEVIHSLGACSMADVGDWLAGWMGWEHCDYMYQYLTLLYIAVVFCYNISVPSVFSISLYLDDIFPLINSTPASSNGISPFDIVYFDTERKFNIAKALLMPSLSTRWCHCRERTWKSSSTLIRGFKKKYIYIKNGAGCMANKTF